MFRFIFLLIFLFCCYLVLDFVIAHDGRIFVDWFGYEIYASASLSIFVIFVIFLLLIYLYRLVATVFSLPIIFFNKLFGNKEFDLYRNVIKLHYYLSYYDFKSSDKLISHHSLFKHNKEFILLGNYLYNLRKNNVDKAVSIAIQLKEFPQFSSFAENEIIKLNLEQNPDDAIFLIENQVKNCGMKGADKLAILSSVAKMICYKFRNGEITDMANWIKKIKSVDENSIHARLLEIVYLIYRNQKPEAGKLFAKLKSYELPHILSDKIKIILGSDKDKIQNIVSEIEHFLAEPLSN